MKIIINNLAIEYEDKGEGRVILFLHGWKENLHTFDSLTRKLSDSLRVIRIDLPGFGKSEMPPNAWGLYEYVDCVENIIEKIHINVDTAIGHSFGGRVIIKGLAMRIFRARRAVLIASAGIAKRNTPRIIAFNILAKIGKVITLIPPFVFMRKALRKKLYTKAGNDYENAGPLKETFLKTINEDLSESASRITTPTLIVWGENDMETPLHDGKRLARLIQGSRLTVIPNAGHFVHKEKTEEIAKIIEDFITA